MAVKKKFARVKTGLAGVPTNKGLDGVIYYFQYDLDKKVISDIIKKHAKKRFTKAEYEAIVANPEYNFGAQTGIAAALYWTDNGNPLEEKFANYPDHITNYFSQLIESGHEILLKKQDSDNETKVVISPIQRLQLKVFDTILADLDQLEDDWFDGLKSDFNMYAAFQVHGLKPRAIPMIKPRIEFWIKEYQDAYDRTCEDAYNGYKHLGKRELSRRIKVLNTILEDFEKIKVIFKPTRKKKTA